MASFEDPSEYAPFHKATPSPQDVNAFHTNSDKDSSPWSQHHTLGNNPNQAAPGNHIHGQAGSVFMGTPVASVVVVFPEEFAEAPVVTATCTTGGNVALIPNLTVTTTGFTAFIYGIGGSWSSGAVSLFWHAIPYSS